MTDQRIYRSEPAAHGKPKFDDGVDERGPAPQMHPSHGVVCSLLLLRQRNFPSEHVGDPVAVRVHCRNLAGCKPQTNGRLRDHRGNEYPGQPIHRSQRIRVMETA